MSLLLTLLVSWIQLTFSEDELADKFVPTSEWTEINEGQSIGRGLHVRLNLETGKKEAKFLSEEDTKQSESNSVTIVEDNVLDFTREPLDEVAEGLKHVTKAGDTPETVSGKFRTIDELKKVMPNLKMMTEGQQLKEKIERLNKTSLSDISTLIVLLEDVEDLAHKYDNGLLLVSESWMGVVGSLMHHSNEQVYTASLRVVTSAAQSNPTVQKHCIQSGYLSFLISQLPSQQDKVAKSSVLSISAMMRNLPAALQTFSELSSYSILTSKLVLSSHPPLQRVIVSLYNDLLQLDTQLNTDTVERSMKLESEALCDKVSEMLLSESSQYDDIQEAVMFYSTARHWCDSGITAQITNRLKELNKKFDNDDDDDELIELIRRLLSDIDSSSR